MKMKKAIFLVPIVLAAFSQPSFAGSPVVWDAACASGILNLFTNSCIANGAGGVSAVTGTAPIVSSGGATPAISIPVATTSANGYLASTDWNTFNNKFLLPSLTAGSVLFSNGSTIVQNNADFFWDNTNFRLGINNATPLSDLEVTESGTNTVRGIVDGQYSSSVNGAKLDMRKARGTRASPSVITSGDNLGVISAEGYDGTNYLQDASIIFSTEGTIAATQVPTIIRFSTATNAAPSVVTEAMRIDSSQRVGVGTTSLTSLFNVGSTDQFQVNSTGAIASATGITSSGTINFSGLTASSPVFTDASKNLTNAGTVPVVDGGTGTSTAFTQGSVVFAGASGVYSQDNTKLFWNDTSDWLGINDSAPANRINVNTPATADSLAQVLIGTASATNKALVLQSSPSQSANLEEWQGSTGAINALVGPTGFATFNGVSVLAPQKFSLGTSGLGTTAEDGLLFSTGSQATSGVPVQYATQLHLGGTAWNTGSSASNTTDWTILSVPVSGNPVTGSFTFNSQVNAGGYTSQMTLKSGAQGVVFTGPVSTTHIIGTTTTPTIAAGAGAGGSPVVSVTGTDLAGNISVLSGTVPTASSVIATVTFNKTYGSAPFCVITPTTTNTALAVTSDYVTTTTTTLVLNATSVALSSATQFNWNYICSQ
jgi:hypothetical protein